jgi:hypothetical protein
MVHAKAGVWMVASFVSLLDHLIRPRQKRRRDRIPEATRADPYPRPTQGPTAPHPHPLPNRRVRDRQGPQISTFSSTDIWTITSLDATTLRASDAYLAPGKAISGTVVLCV